MPSTKKTHKLASGRKFYVAVDGRPENDGSIRKPWSLSHAFGGAVINNEPQIHPGDTVFVRGGTYRSEADFEITVSGTATNKITFKANPGETVILDGALPEFTTTGNTAWVEDETFSPCHNVYHSTRKYPVKSVFYGGLLQIDSKWYSLAPHAALSYLLSDTQEWQYPQPNPRYLGPGISQIETVDSPSLGYIFIRLDNSAAQAQLGRRVAQIDGIDPRNHEIYLCKSDRFGLRITGSHLIIEGFTQINHFAGCFLMNTPGQTDIAIRNCGGRPIYFGARCGYVDGLTFDSCKFYAHMPSDTWWVAYEDIKGARFPDNLQFLGEPPADHVRKVGLDLGLATNVKVLNCLLDEFFDGILAKGKQKDDDPTAHDIEVDHTTFDHIWDDTWQMTGSLYNVNFHHNFCYGAGPSIDNPQANDKADTVYIHHNLIDTTTRLVFRGRLGSPGMGSDEPSPLPSHISSHAYSWPRKLYYNTIVTGQTCGGADVGWALPKADTQQGTHEVYNNIFLVADGRPGGRDFDATNGHEIYDGNVYWCYFAYSNHVRSPWRLLTYYIDNHGHKQTINLLNYNPARNVITVAQLQAFLIHINWGAYYSPGWEKSGLSEDPKLDKDYKPQNPSCQKGAVNLKKKRWPGTEIYEAWRGAVNPF